MSRRRGRRYDDSPKLNKKKVFATIVVIIIIILVIISLKNLLTGSSTKSQDVSSLTTYMSAYENGKWGVIDNKGNIVINLSYDEMILIPNKNEDIFICTYDVNYDNETYKTKVIDSQGNDILTQYENVEPLQNTDGSIIWYEDNVLKYTKDGKYGLIDFSGKELIRAEYDNIYALPGIEKSIIIEKDGKKGLVNSSTGRIIIDPNYLEISSISNTYENGYIVRNDQNKLGIIGVDKTKILDEKYDDIKRITDNKYYVVVENGETKVINSSEETIFNSGFDSIEGIESDNFIIIRNGLYGVLDKTGNELIPAEYQNIKFANSGNFIAQRDGKYGIIGKDNITKIDFNYENISYIKEADFFEADKSDYTTDIIDTNFNTVLSNIIISELNVEDGYLRVREGEDYKFYNFKFEEKSNKEILATNTLFLIKENGKYGYENKNGERIVDCIYDDAKEQNEFGFCAVNKEGLWGVLGSDGTIIVEPSRNLDNYLYIDFIGEWNRFNDLSINVYTK